MTVLDKILSKLNGLSVKYEKIEHAPVYTSEQAAKIRDSDISIGAKALVCVADKKPILLVVPGDKKADFKKIKTDRGIKDLRLATPDEVKILTTLEIGAIPPVGSVMGLKSLYDFGFKTKDVVTFNAGSHTVSVVMKAKDLIMLENPDFGDIVK